MGAFAARVHGAENPRRCLYLAAGFSALGLLPDLDVVWVAMGLPDAGTWGHRGFTHSLSFAVVVAVTAALVARRFHLRPLYTGFFVLLVVGSHGPLDALTSHSRGVPLFWPFSDARISSPWRPIPVAPTGLDFMSARGLEIALVELIYFLPLIVLAFWPSRARRADCNHRRAVIGGLAVVGAIAACVSTAQLLLHDSWLVELLEASTLRELAVKAHRQEGLTSTQGPSLGGGQARASAHLNGP